MLSYFDERPIVGATQIRTLEARMIYIQLTYVALFYVLAIVAAANGHTGISLAFGLFATFMLVMALLTQKLKMPRAPGS